MLAPLPTVVFTIGIVLYHLSWCECMYVRAHREEPFLRLSVLFCIVTGGLVWALGREFGALGSALGYLAVIALIFVPGVHLIWKRYRFSKAED
jgi:O-antigen/teichoic acid export membrane protein